jgi:hypothetical protein
MRVLDSYEMGFGNRSAQVAGDIVDFRYIEIACADQFTNVAIMRQKLLLLVNGDIALPQTVV